MFEQRKKVEMRRGEVTDSLFTRKVSSKWRHRMHGFSGQEFAVKMDRYSFGGGFEW
jgi:hypothetical protein